MHSSSIVTTRELVRNVAPLLLALVLLAAVPAAASGTNVLVQDPDRAFIGIRIGQSSAAGVQVHSVVPGSAADRAGLAAGDVIVGIGYAGVTGTEELHRLLGELTPGDRVELAVQRDGVERRLDVELGSRAGALRIELDGTFTVISPRMRGTIKGTVVLKHPSQVEDTYVCQEDNCRFSGDDLVWYRIDCIGRGCPAYAMDFYERPVLGVRLLSGRERLDREAAGNTDGLLVGEVFVGGPAWEAGVEVGDVIVDLDETPIARPRDLRRALDGSEGGMMELGVVRDEEPLRLRLYLPHD